MGRLLLIGFGLFFLFGCLPVSSHEISSGSGRQQGHYGGELARAAHPLSHVQRTVTFLIPRLIPFTGSTVDGYHPRRIIRRNSDCLFPIPGLPVIHPEIDVAGSVDKAFPITFLEQGSYPSMVTLSHERYLHLQLDNDIFNYTDRFYTNGITISLVAPGLRHNPLVAVLVPYWHRGINYYGITLVQNMYTPSTTKIGGILYGDRPYAAYLYIGTTKTTNDETRKLRLTSELQLGILGPSSLGEYVQRTFHNAVPTNNEPLGWEFQIHDDLLINYRVNIEKGIVGMNGFDLLIYGTGFLGSTHTNLGGGTVLRGGWFNPYFENLYFSTRSLNRIRHARNLQFYFFLDLHAKAVGYDATLQGGVLNKTSPYTISSGDLNRIMFIGAGGIVFSYGGFQLKGEQFLQSPEFMNGWWHKWLTIGLTFSF